MTDSASTTRTIAEAHARLKAHGEIQFDLPHATPTPLSPPPDFRFLDGLWKWMSDNGNLIWIVAGIAAVIVVALVARWAIGQRSDSQATAPRDEIAEWRPEAKAARALLAEAEAMAAAGRYDEAVHLLLQRSLEDIAKRRPRLLRPALTSREIARVPALPDVVRRAFAAMAAPVERSLFGGRTLGRDAWEEARGAYKSFALPEAWA